MAADSLSNSPKLKWNKDYFKDGKVFCLVVKIRNNRESPQDKLAW